MAQLKIYQLEEKKRVLIDARIEVITVQVEEKCWPKV